MRTEAEAPEALAAHPDYVVVSGWERGPDQDIGADWLRPDADVQRLPDNDTYRIIPYAEAHGYRITHGFCGDAWMRASYAERLCDVVLEPEH